MQQEDVDPTLQRILRDEVDAMTHIVNCFDGIEALFIAVVANDKGGLHFQVTTTADTTPKMLTLALGVQDALATCIRDGKYKDLTDGS